MNLGVNKSLKRKISEYIEKNMGLLRVLYSCDDPAGLTYDEMVKYLEEKRENTAGLLIRLERGINLGFIGFEDWSGLRGLRDRKYFLSEKGEELYLQKERSIDKDEERKFIDEKEKKERTTRMEYIA